MHALVICEPWQVSERFKTMEYRVSSLSLEACCWETSESWRGLSCALTQGPSTTRELGIMDCTIKSSSHFPDPSQLNSLDKICDSQRTGDLPVQAPKPEWWLCFCPCQPGADPSTTTKGTYSVLLQKEVYHLLSHPCHILTPACGLAGRPLQHESTLSTDGEKVCNKTSNHTRLFWMGRYTVISQGSWTPRRKPKIICFAFVQFQV